MGISRPSADLVVTNWWPSTGSALYAVLNEVTADAEGVNYSTMLPSTLEMALSPAVPAGSCTVRFTALSFNIGSLYIYGSLTLELLDAANGVLWWFSTLVEAGDQTYSTFNLPVSIAAPAVKLRVTGVPEGGGGT